MPSISVLSKLAIPLMSAFPSISKEPPSISPLAVTVVNTPVFGVVAPIEVLFIVPPFITPELIVHLPFAATPNQRVPSSPPSLTSKILADWEEWPITESATLSAALFSISM